jgi:hypothetical protein
VLRRGLFSTGHINKAVISALCFDAQPVWYWYHRSSCTDGATLPVRLCP